MDDGLGKFVIFLMLASMAMLFGYMLLELNSDTPQTYVPEIESILSKKIDYAVNIVEDSTVPVLSDALYVKTIDGKATITEHFIQEYFQKLAKDNSYYSTWYWKTGNYKTITASTVGTDNEHHFVNGYLVAYEPFETAQLWVPHYVVSMRLRYQLDSDQYSGMADVWQNSKQAFANTRGDCEDHAVLITDWLIEMGLDARVVIGDWAGGGHAWVIVFKGSEVYLLEATDKQKRNHWRYYPLAKFASKYHPEYMFNREYFWVNTGSKYTTDYSGEKWVKKSRYYKSSI